MIYVTNEIIPAEILASLRESVGWNRMEKELSNPNIKSFFHIAVYEEDELIGYIGPVSINSTIKNEKSRQP